MSQFVEKVADAIHDVSSNAHDLAKTKKAEVQDRFMNVPYVDLTIQFIGASGIPKMDVVGTADPYFVAKIDDKISMVSTVKTNTLTPVWNEIWRVKNVPSIADLTVEVLDKDVGAPHDDFIGKFKTSVTAGAKELEIEGPLFRKDRGTFWLKIETKPSSPDRPYSYLFDGPIRYSRHFSPTVGRLTNLDDARLYSTWKMYLVGVPVHFKDVHQHWNRNYKAAQSIFQGPASIAVRTGIQAGHRMLYARSTSNGFGVIERPEDVVQLLHGGNPQGDASQGTTGSGCGTTEGDAGANANASTTDANPTVTESSSSSSGGSPYVKQFAHRVKPAVYTYIISSEDDSFRFSETGAAFFVDFASKHALHANCFPTVRYSGEFHPRPRGGWQNFSDDVPDEGVQWELVIDNNSGTYSPDKGMLPVLKELLEENFPGFGIFALDREDEELVRSREACREYALKFRGVRKEHLQPTAKEGEETLMHQASTEGVTAKIMKEVEKLV